MWGGFFSTRLQQQLLVKCVGCYIVAGFIAVELAWFLSCRPFAGYWALPVPMGTKSFFLRVCVLRKC